MKRLRVSLFALLTGLSLLLAGCSGAVSLDLMAGVEAAEWPGTPEAPPAAFADALRTFSWNILRESTANEGNLLVSPASIYLALAMTLNGADGTTREAMLAALASDDLTVEALDAACRDWMTRMGRTEADPVMTIANSIWLREGFVADQAFLQANADFFAAGARALDFSKQEALDTINGWVLDATRGKIDKILERIGPAAVMYLVNAIHFKADWKTPFIKNYTADGSFAAPAGSVTVPFMHHTGPMAFVELDGARGVLLDYEDPRFAFLALLPPDGQDPRQWAGTASGTWLASLLASARTTGIDLSLPQFETAYSDSLLDEMDRLGMGVAFGAGADFSRMTPERSRDLFISEIKHKTFCAINETGTEAAAATLVEISKTAPGPAEVVLDVDRPFLYGILDIESGIPIFLGIMENPAE